MITKKAQKYLKLVDPEIVEGSANGKTVEVSVLVQVEPPLRSVVRFPISQVINRGGGDFWVVDWLIARMNKERRQKTWAGVIQFDYEGTVTV